MSPATVAASISALAYVYHQPQNELSFHALCRDIWVKSGGVAVSEDALATVFAERPELVDSWLTYSQDQRSSDAWYLEYAPQAAEASRWVVGNTPSGKILRFPDRAAACAAFVARAVGEPYVARKTQRHGS